MTETQKRIKAYERALPHMKERVTAIAMLLVVSISMLISSSFAWITLSRSPEVVGMETTFATNGNLEIALSDIDGLEPDDTAVGDGGQDVRLSNVTWGNLVNLSSASYGLDQLTLRPAILNSGSLSKSPLYSVTYGEDGRIADIISDFAFTNYETKDGASAFFVPENGQTKYGVRAVSSVTYSSVSGDAQLMNLNNAVSRALTLATVDFQTLYGNKDYMNSITNLAGVYLSYRMDDVDQDCTGYVEIIYTMMCDYYDTLNLVGDALVAIANLHHFVYCNQNNETYNAFTRDELNAGTVKTVLAREGITLTAMDTYLKDCKTFFGTATETGLFENYKTNVYNVWQQGNSIGWELMRNYINPMANINTATINGTAAQSLGASDLASIAFASNKVCELKSGLIWDMDKMLGTKLSVTNVSVKAMGFNITLSEIRTSAAAPFYMVDDKAAAEQKAAAGGLAATDAVAADTYGMVVDFWLRTNSPNALLTLEGELIKETVVVTDEEGNPETDEEGNPIMQTIVTGYSGANRIWEANDPELPILGTSTSQGSGSCYIFYPETPEEQAQALEMLRAMCIAFVSEDGTLLAQADLDTVNALEEYGRILVPVQLRAKTITSTDPEGNTVTENSYHITEMVQNEATRITALVYMDGSRLGNSQVLSAGSIKGQLNLQFGTSEDIVSMDDKELKKEFYNITLTATNTEFDGYDSENPPTTSLALAISGMEASSVKGNFVSYISATQGARQPQFSFEKQENGEWTADVTFTGAGSYQLRSVQIDGVDYLLDEEDRVTVYIPGVTVASLVCDGWDGANSYSKMTADSYFKQSMLMTLNVGPNMNNPRNVQAVFAQANGQNVTVAFTRTNEGWIGDATFTTGGTYTLSYVIIDGDYVALDPALQKTLNLKLGLQARVFLSQPATETYLEAKETLEAAEASEIAAVRSNAALTEAQKEERITAITTSYDAQYAELLEELNGTNGLNMSIINGNYQFIYDGAEPLFMDVSVAITDDHGNVIAGETDVELHYGIGASVVNRLDSDLIWNASSKRYEGQFQLTRPGVYGFQNLEMGSNTIYTASSAPKITAISPTPISYVGKSSSYTTYYENISASATRDIRVVLSDAPAAQVVLTLEHSDESVETTIQEMSAEMIYADEENNRYEFVPYYTDGNGDKKYGVPTDGTWKIVGMKIASAFYNEVYYDGVPQEEGGTGWLDWSDKVQASNIVTDYFTTVNFSASANPGAYYETEFMVGKTFENMTFTLTDYLGNALDGVSIGLKYTWDTTTNDSFSVASGSNLSYTTFGSDSLTSTDGKTFRLGTMDFKLDGTYKCDFSIVVNGKEYTAISDFTVPENGGFSANDVMINWILPEVKFTATNPAAGTSFDVNVGGSGNSSDIQSKSNSIDNAYTITAYFQATRSGGGSTCNPYSVSYTVSTATAQLSGAGAYESATLTIDGSTDMTFNFTTASPSVTANVGSVSGSSNKTKNIVGTGTAGNIDLVHNGVTYTTKLKQGLTVYNNN